jgi:hypothetical protein
MIDSVWAGIMANHRILAILALGVVSAISTVEAADAQQAIGSATTAQNQVTRELGEPRRP